MQTNTAPTKGNLMAAKNTLRLSQRGYDMLDKKRISEYERLRARAGEYGVSSSHYQFFTDFCSTCDNYKAGLKSGASVELLQEYKAFLFDSENVRPKYERIKNW